MPLPIVLNGTLPRLYWRLSGPAQRLEWKLFSRAWVACARQSQEAAYGAGWSQMPLELPADLAAGTYYLELKAFRGGAVSGPRVIKLMVLR